MNKIYKVCIPLAIFYFVVVASLNGLNVGTLLVVAIGWTFTFAAAATNALLVDVSEALNECKNVKMSMLQSQLMQSQCPANLDIKNANNQTIIENQNIVAIEDPLEEDVAVKKE
jgi:hypothetical protein